MTVTVSELDQSLKTLVDWEGFGTQLRAIDVSVISITKKDVTGVENQKRELFKRWLSRCPDACWSDVVSALDKTGEKTLAKEVNDKYTKQTSNSPSTTEMSETYQPKTNKQQPGLSKSPEPEMPYDTTTTSKPVHHHQSFTVYAQTERFNTERMNIQTIRSALHMSQNLVDNYESKTQLQEKMEEELRRVSELATQLQSEKDELEKSMKHMYTRWKLKNENNTSAEKYHKTNTLRRNEARIVTRLEAEMERMFETVDTRLQELEGRLEDMWIKLENKRTSKELK